MFRPERLTLARARRGMKKSELAAALGIITRTLASYETGLTEPTTKMVNQMSKVLGFPLSFFEAPLGDFVPADAASFRALSRMTARQRDSALGVGTLGIALNEWIEQRFELPEPQIPNLQPGLIDPEGAAAHLRALWGLGEDPIPHMLHLVEAHGVRVFSLAEECKEVDAFSFWNGSTPYVCLATYKTAERSIFDCAHELGHLVLHRDHAAPRGRPAEREADEFASAFLMPRADVLAHGPRRPTFDDLVLAKSRWRVSAAALNFRLHQLGLSSDWNYRELCIEFSRRGRDNEPAPLPRERSQLLDKVFGAMRDEAVTRKDIADDLHLSMADLDSLTFGLSLTVVGGSAERTEPVQRPSLRLV